MAVPLVFDIQRFSIQDGPGIRTTVFLKGCPLSCGWCHNPESQAPGREVMTLEHRCIRCGAHLEVCPGGDNRSGCTTCGRCVEACPTGARQMAGRPYEIEELTRIVLQDRPFYEESGGGVTFSGGEPLLHPEYLAAALEAARAHGLHTAVDTCGFASPGDLLAVARHTDLFLYDLKLIDPERHRQHTGVSNTIILQNLERLAREHGNLWIRIPVIPGVNDDDAAAGDAAAFLAPLPGIREVHLLPYHLTGETKFARLGRSYSLAGTPVPTAERMHTLAGIYEDQGLVTRIVGRARSREF